MPHFADLGVLPSPPAAGADDFEAEQIALDLPNVVLRDCGLTSGAGARLARRLRERFPDLLILVLMVSPDDPSAVDAMCAGTCEHLLQKTAEAQPRQSLRKLMNGGVPMSPLRQAIRAFPEIRPWKLTGNQLTPYQARLLKLLAEGHSYRMAAVELGVTADTVSFHRRRIYEKLRVHSKSEAVSKALRHGLIQ
jgi:DNA-binding NarL/FixJ family response regulator